MLIWKLLLKTMNEELLWLFHRQRFFKIKEKKIVRLCFAFFLAWIDLNVQRGNTYFKNCFVHFCLLTSLAFRLFHRDSFHLFSLFRLFFPSALFFTVLIFCRLARKKISWRSQTVGRCSRINWKPWKNKKKLALWKIYTINTNQNWSPSSTWPTSSALVTSLCPVFWGWKTKENFCVIRWHQSIRCTIE